MVDQQKNHKPYLQPEPLLEIFAMTNLRRAAIHKGFESAQNLQASVEWSCALVNTSYNNH